MKRKGNGQHGLYKKVSALKSGGTIADPAVTGLRYVARETKAAGVTVYAQLRYKHPLTGKWTPVGLGRLPTPAEIEAERAIDAADLPPEAVGPAPVDHYAFHRIRAEASKQLAMVRKGVDPKTAGGPQGVTVAEAIERHYTAPRKHPLAASSVALYRKQARLYLAPWLDTPLTRLDPPAVVNMWETIHREHGQANAVGALRLLSAAWRTARFHDQRIPPFPQLPRGALSNDAPKKSAMPNSALPQWFKELSRVKDGQRRQLWLLGIMTGMRHNDLKTIRREHVDLAAARLHIPCPKGGARRAYTIPLSDAALELVSCILRSHNSEWLFPRNTKSGHIEHPEPLPSDGFSIDWGLHDLKRTYASIAAAVLQNDFHVSYLLNHKKKGVTAGYVQLEVDDVRASQQAVTDRLRKLGLPL